MVKITSPGTAGAGLFEVDTVTREIFFDPQGSGGDWAENATTETRLSTLIRDATGKIALTNAIVNVIRAGGFDRLNLPGLRLLYDTSIISSVILDGSNKIERLRDLSGVADAYQPISSNRPNWSSTPYSANKLASFFNGAGRLQTPINVTGPSNAQGQSFFVLGTYSGSTTAAFLIDQSPGAVGFFFRQVIDFNFLARSNATGSALWSDSVSIIPPDKLFLLQADVMPGIGMRMRVNKSEWFNSSYPQHDYFRYADEPLVFGSNVEGDSPWQGMIGEAAVFSPYLSTSDADNYTDDIFARWGIIP